ncbi:MAG: MauE/DoxX family redox-associated membrane protein [Propionicimonas sp.]
MLADAWLLAPLTLLAVLAVSGIAKAGKPGVTLAAMRDLRVPERLRRRWIAQTLPWGEVALAVALLIGSGWVLQGVSLAVAALMAGYLLLVVLAVRRPEPADCACFGELGASQVTGRTVLRNALLLAGAAVTVWGAFNGRSTWQSLAALGPAAVGWLAGALGLGLLGWTVGPPVAAPRADVAAPAAAVPTAAVPTAAVPTAALPTAAEPLADLDYLRTPIPFVRLTSADGSPTTMRDLARTQARLLVFVSSSCNPCAEIISALPGWTADLGPAVAVHAVLRQEPESVARDLPDVVADALFAQDGSAHEILGIEATPAAVLLGADGLLAGGPVFGGAAIRELVAEILDQLAGEPAT